MATIKAFKAIRPKNEYAEKIAALPYDVYNTEEAREEISKHPLSFLQVDLPLATLPEDFDGDNIAINKHAFENFKKMWDEGYFMQEDENCLYLYEMTMKDHTQLGLVCATSVDEYLDGTIKKHEKTRADKEVDRINHIDSLDANTGPIFLTYKNEERIKNTIKQCVKCDAEIDFTSDDGIRHRIWTIRDENIISDLVNYFAEIPNLYIADGHHRSASAAKVSLKRREQNPGFKGDEEFNYFLSILFPSDNVQIYDYNRVLKDLNGLSEEELFEKIEENFKLEKSTQQVKPSKKSEFGMYLNNNWYKLTYKGENTGDVIEDLDVSILQNKLLSPILGIQDPRTDKRIDFIGGIRGIEELEKRVEDDMEIAFSLYPTSLEELMAVADANKEMPPKSTWFEPKPRSGLFIHNLK
ncbi:putative protein [Peptoniphilus sp. ING2-D1G]|nr:putative protein [Peptoniphilus sp. ING2-D1G]